jgi:hypothetical protein
MNVAMSAGSSWRARGGLSLGSLTALMLWAASAVSSPALAAPTIEARIDGGPWLAAPAVYPLKGQKVELRVPSAPGARIRWFRILPDTATLYHNAEWPWAPRDAYRWLGFDRIGYHREPLPVAEDAWSLVLDTRAGLPQASVFPLPADGGNAGRLTSERIHARHDVGSFWYQVEVVRGAHSESSPGFAPRDARGLPPRVFRVSIRDGDGFLGWLTSFFNVPAVFGSTPYQSENYIGVDCADVLMAAHHRHSSRPLKEDFNVQRLAGSLRIVAEIRVAQGTPERALRFGAQILPGDLIAVRYAGGRVFQHIGALYRDANGNGVLDGEDTVLHVGPEPLHESRLDEGAFDGTVRILRLP